MCAERVCGGQSTTWELGLFFCCVVSGDQTQVIELGGKYLPGALEPSCLPRPQHLYLMNCTLFLPCLIGSSLSTAHWATPQTQVNPGAPFLQQSLTSGGRQSHLMSCPVPSFHLFPTEAPNVEGRSSCSHTGFATFSQELRVKLGPFCTVRFDQHSGALEWLLPCPSSEARRIHS